VWLFCALSALIWASGFILWQKPHLGSGWDGAGGGVFGVGM